MADIYELSDEVKQVMVDGLRRGFVEFIEEKAKKKDEMAVSSGYSWTRGNHIDNEINKALVEQNMGTSKLRKSGSWKFLRFNLIADEHRVWLVQKPISFVRKSDNLAKHDAKHQSLISIWGNTVNAKYGDLFSGESQEIDLFDSADDIEDININNIRQDQADAFYLLTYEVSKDNDITSVQLNIIYDGKVKKIADLNEFNAASPVEIPSEIREKLEPEEVIDPNVEQSSSYEYYKDVTAKNDDLTNKNVGKNK